MMIEWYVDRYKNENDIREVNNMEGGYDLDLDLLTISS